ncbi:hypothetical protein [Luteimonas sp. FCS-9]|uniref:hypothetical protein n=1 Tax=Luteimonas sp. FCS-9 TaxID=1547516 RepID=UPI00063EAB5C|nr:hypothetical protein [Luteimonas sp. FCS-9]KLJ02906.1 hypothetical protein WQ56_01145 [Luteimonas sp. FCS-9]
MVRRLLSILPLLLACVPAAQARTAEARIARVATPVATLERVRLTLDWPEDAPQGRLRLRAGLVDAGALGWRLRDVDWRCPLTRIRPEGASVRWRCDGPVRDATGAALRLSLELDGQDLDARLADGDGALQLARRGAAPDRTAIDLRSVPVAWAQALVREAWAAAQLRDGRLDGALWIDAPADAPVRIAGTLAVRDLALDTEDGAIATEGVGADLRVDLRLPDAGPALRLDGALRGGGLLFGPAYLALPDTPIALGLDLARNAAGDWALPRLAWHDGAALRLDGTAALSPEGGLRTLSLVAASRDAAPLPSRYLSGWLGPAGLSGLTLHGGVEASLALSGGALREADLRLRGLDVGDAEARFRFDRLDGAIRYSAQAPVRSAFAWRGGALYGMPFDAAAWSLESARGRMRLREPVALSFLGGEIGFEALALQLPGDDGDGQGGGLRMRTALRLDELDIGRLAAALDWPAFEGRLSGHIPTVRYADNRIDFDGGLSMQLFGGRVDVSSLAIERPFGVAPTVSSDLAIEALDLHALTGVFGFGSIEGRLHGRIDGLRLIDWTATAFDAELHTLRTPGVRQRISQRAVQDISSVGDASFVTSLQGRAIALFDDFGYRGIGISCRLRNQVCRMGGLRSAGNTFTIVDGAGLPRLDVVGFNRDVDWPTLVERLAAAAGGDVAPVID